MRRGENPYEDRCPMSMDPRPSTVPDPLIEAYKRHVDRTLLIENLKLSIDERLLRLIELQRFAAELHRAGREAREKA
jgi:hypothetical protein